MGNRLLALGAGLMVLAACGGSGTTLGDAGKTATTTAAPGATTTSAPGATGGPDTGDSGVTTAPTSAAGATTAGPSATTAAASATTAAASPTTAGAKPTTTKASATATTAPVTFVSFSVTADNCPTPPAPDVSYTAPPSSPMVTVTWKLAGVIPDDVWTAIDDPNGVFDHVSTQGTAQFSRDCSGGTPTQHTYYVVAKVGAKLYVKSKKV